MAGKKIIESVKSIKITPTFNFKSTKYAEFHFDSDINAH